MNLEFQSSLPYSFRNKLEKLFFFNGEQSIVYSKIENALEKYGNPKLIEKNSRIRISVEKIEDCQNLILIDTSRNKLLGIMLHSRINKNEAELIHMAINKEHNNTNVFELLFDEIIRIYSKIKDVRYLHITYIKKRIKIK